MKRTILNFKKFVVFLLVFSIFYLSGCEAFRKKFTRKPKKKEKEIEDIVFVPIEYPEVSYSKDEVYKNQYLFWKGWHSELINNVYDGASRKRQIDCINEALKRLNKMKGLLNSERQKEIDIYIQKMNEIRKELLDSRFIMISSMKRKLVSLQNKIQKSFSYRKVKDFIE